MKRWSNVAGLLLVAAVVFFGFAAAGFAAEGAGGWRETYDTVLKWINFAILAFIIVKYAKTPLKEFVSGQRKDLIRDLERKEAEKKAVLERVEAVIADLKENEGRIEALKARIAEQGEKRRQEIIDDAREKSRLMLADVQMRMENRISQAKYRLRAEIVESAVALALDRLPKIVNEDDNQKFIDIFVSGTASK